jgi:hypothetical protein
MGTRQSRSADMTGDAPALDFQFDCTIDGNAVKIASMVDEHTRESLLNIFDESTRGLDSASAVIIVCDTRCIRARR